ncbi:MAG: dihydroorotase family protein [Promethearchaeota archaeon]
MILKNAKIYSEGLIRRGNILIIKGVIHKIEFNLKEKQFKKLVKKNSNDRVIDCENKLILPGIIDIHSHLRDMDQSEKETFLTSTKAAAFSGITTVFNMPNTKPPAITSNQIKVWMEKAKNNIYIDVGFIAGVPKGIDDNEIKKIIDLGVIGFKIYSIESLSEIDWSNPENLHKLFNISSSFQIPIFIHASSPLSLEEKEQIKQEFHQNIYTVLEYHDRLNPVKAEEQYVRFVIHNYLEYITTFHLDPKNYPIIHFCHISCIESFSTIQKILTRNKNLKITFEVTPHHLILSNKILLNNDNFGKVLPPLRKEEHSKFLLDELKKGTIKLIGTDHAPHTLEEKSIEFDKTPSGFPGFETYPLVLLHKVFNFEFSLESFVRIASENPAKIFNLNKKGFIREGYDADLLILDKGPNYNINPQSFKTKAKFSPFEKYSTSVYIWKVFLRGIEVNIDNSIPNGKIIRRML